MTPIQLVTMVSTIANGGVYMPPHVLLQSTDEMKGDPRLQPAAFHPENQLPATLPDGAHRVITELTAAKMRSMMQGIVVEGTGKAAALNGYSSGGKTGTAQKIDPATHTYSHTKLVASFAGFAPVSSSGDLRRGGHRHSDGGQRLRRGRSARRSSRRWRRRCSSTSACRTISR